MMRCCVFSDTHNEFERISGDGRLQHPCDDEEGLRERQGGRRTPLVRLKLWKTTQRQVAADLRKLGHDP